jgi:general secretion pathway protein L
MPQRLLIRYRGPGQPLAWLAEDESGRAAVAGDGQAPEPRVLAQAAQTTVLVPVEDCLLLEADVAARSREQLLRAVPFAVEDQLAEPVEGLHFSAAPHPRGHGQLVAAVRRERLQAWLDDLSARGVRADRVLVDALLLPCVEGAASALADGERVLVRTGVARAFAAGLDELGEWLDLSDVPRDADGRRSVRVHGARLPRLDPARFAVVRQPGPDDALAALAALGGVPGAAGQLPDLLVGPFAPGHREAPLRRRWRLAAWLAAAAVVLGFGGLLLDRYLLSGRLATLDAEMAAVWTRLHPGSAVPPNLVERLRADYRAGAGGARGDDDGALGLLARVAPLLGANPQVFVKGVEYRAGALELVLIAPAVADLDSLREQIATVPGLGAELAAANASERGTEGRVRVQRSGA